MTQKGAFYIAMALCVTLGLLDPTEVAKFWNGNRRGSGGC